MLEMVPVREQAAKPKLAQVMEVQEAVREGSVKVIGVEQGSCFHASVLFAVMYARAGKVFISGKINEDIIDVIRGLDKFDVSEDEIEDVVDSINSGKLFTIRLMRIEDTLREFILQRILIEVAA